MAEDIYMRVASKKVLVSIPEPLLKKLDAKAEKEKRSRSAEVCFRLERSLKGVRKVSATGVQS